MEQLSLDQQRRNERARKIDAEVEAGLITDVRELDPRETSIEHVQTVRRRLQALGRGTVRQASGL